MTIAMDTGMERLRKLTIDENIIDKIISTAHVEIVDLRPLFSNYWKEERKRTKKRKHKGKERKIKRRRFQNAREEIEQYLPVTENE